MKTQYLSKMAKFHIVFILILMFEDCLTGHIKFRKKFYKSPNGLLCQMCPVGTFLLRPCEENGGESMCSVCPRGTFTDTVNSATGCEECTVCRIRQRQISPCNGTSDRVCECPEGFFWATYLGYDGICLHHTVCKEDEVVAVKGTSTSNTICKKAPPKATLGTLLAADRATSPTPASTDDSRTTAPITTNQNNGTDSRRYSVVKLGHKRPSHHVGIHKLWKPKHIQHNPSANISEILKESHERRDTLVNETVVNAPPSETTVNAAVNGTMESAPPNEIAANTPSNETMKNAPPNETAAKTAANTPSNEAVNPPANGTMVNAPVNVTNSNKSPTQNGKTLSTILPNGITQNPQTQVTPKHSKTTSDGRRRKRKRKRKGKDKKARRRRKKNRKNKKHRRNKKCRHKDERKRQKCERRRQRRMRRKKKAKKVFINNEIENSRTII